MSVNRDCSDASEAANNGLGRLPSAKSPVLAGSERLNSSASKTFKEAVRATTT